MLTRERAVLALLEQAKAPITSIVLTKLTFLLRHEGGIAADIPTFYDFVPYKFGPYSFALHNDLMALHRNNYVEQSGDQWALGRIAGRDRYWIGELSDSASKTIKYVIRTRGALSKDELLKHVYGTFPWYASKSELRNLAPRNYTHSPASATPAVYTVGYQQKTIDGFLAGLIRQGIEAIVDVRSNPVSRNYGFARRTLEALATKVGIKYRHFPQLGIPSEDRKGLISDKQFDSLFLSYQKTVLPREMEAIEEIARMMATTAAALLCYEADPCCCHRSRLAAAIAKASGLTIVHI